MDGAVLIIQPATGAWRTLRSDAAPTSVKPAAPAGAATVDRVLGVSATHILIAWTPTQPDPKAPAVIVTAYDYVSGHAIATVTAQVSDLGPGGSALSKPQA